jgi:hypothetical protein
MSEITSIIDEIKKSKKSIEVFVPSLGSTITLNPITLAQQSKIIETVSDNVNITNNPILALLEFNSITFNILKNNIVEYQPIFNTIDRINFIIALKSHLDKKVVIDEVEFDLPKILERNETLDYNIQGDTLISDEVSIEVSVPSLEVDNVVNTLLLRKYKTSNSQNKKLLSDVYIYEALKFVDKISIGERSQVIKKDTKSLDLLREIDIVTLKPVFEYINKVRALEETYAKNTVDNNILDLTPDIFIS